MRSNSVLRTIRPAAGTDPGRRSLSERAASHGSRSVWFLIQLGALFAAAHRWMDDEGGLAAQATRGWLARPVRLDDDDAGAVRRRRLAGGGHHRGETGQNAAIRALYAPRPTGTVLANWREATELLIDSVAALSEEDIATPGAIPGIGTSILADGIAGDTFGHHAHHAAEVRTWLDESVGMGR